MTYKTQSLGKKIFYNTNFAIIDLILTKVGTIVAFVLLVRLLPENDIATIGIAMGYVVLAAYLEVGPIRVLLRDYPKIAKNHNERDHLLTALFLFFVLQSIAMLLLCFGLDSFVFSKLNLPALSFLFFGMVIDFIALAFREWIKTIFYTDFQQAFATTIGFFLTVFRLACYAILFFWPSLENYTWILIITSFVSCTIWGVIFQRRFHYRININRNTIGILKKSLASYGLWDHLNRMAIDTLFLIDTVILSWFVLEQLQDIGNYTIALKFTSLLFLIPMQLNRSLQVALSNYSEDTKRFEAINTFIKVNAIVSFTQLLFVFVCGNWLIRLLFGADTNTDVYKYVTIITVGVTIICLSWPFISIINNFCSLRNAFFVVFLPAMVIGCSIYIETAARWGAIGIAYGNIAVYAILAFGLILFVAKKYPFSLKLQLITADEKKLFQEVISRKRI